MLVEIVTFTQMETVIANIPGNSWTASLSQAFSKCLLLQAIRVRDSRHILKKSKGCLRLRFDFEFVLIIGNFYFLHDHQNTSSTTKKLRLLRKIIENRKIGCKMAYQDVLSIKNHDKFSSKKFKRVEHYFRNRKSQKKVIPKNHKMACLTLTRTVFCKKMVSYLYLWYVWSKIIK